MFSASIKQEYITHMWWWCYFEVLFYFFKLVGSNYSVVDTHFLRKKIIIGQTLRAYHFHHQSINIHCMRHDFLFFRRITCGVKIEKFLSSFVTHKKILLHFFTFWNWVNWKQIFLVTILFRDWNLIVNLLKSKVMCCTCHILLPLSLNRNGF